MNTKHNTPTIPTSFRMNAIASRAFSKASADTGRPVVALMNDALTLYAQSHFTRQYEIARAEAGRAS